MMKTSLVLSFERASINGHFYNFLFDNYIRFEPYSFTKGYKVMNWNPTKHPRLILQSKGGESIGVIDKKGNIFSVDETGTKRPHQSITITQDKSLFYPSNKEVESIITYSNSFVSAYLHHWEYTYVQSNSSESTFNYKDIPKEILDTLKRVPYKLGVFDIKEYDTRFNPGRLVLIEYTWIMAAWKMWFGLPFFKIIPKQKIMDFPYAVEIKELKNGQVFVQLYENIDEAYLPENTFRQWKWQEWLNFDTLIQES